MNSASRPERHARPAQVVLVVEDEPVLRASMVRGLAKLPGIEVLDAGSVRDALELLRVYPPALVISDLDLPDGSGVEVAGALERAGRHVPIVFVTAYLSRFRARLPERPGVEVHEKPLALDRLRQIVTTRLGAEEPEAQPFGVIDYVQLAGMGRRSVVIEVRGQLSGVGRIVVRQGEVWSAVDERGDGLDAFRRMAFLRNASVACRAPVEGEIVERNVNGSCESVLLEVARQFDEARRDASSWRPGAPSVPPPAPAAEAPHPRDPVDELASGWEEAPPASRGPAPAQRFEELYDLGVDALLARKHAEAYRHFEAASLLRPSDPSVVANLNRLREMGYAS